MFTVAITQDNYSWVLLERASGKTAVVDPAEAQPVIAALDTRSVTDLLSFAS